MRAPFIITHRAVRALVRAFPVVSDSRRGYVIEIGNGLVRLRDEEDGWRFEILPQAPSEAHRPGHVHSISPITLRDGWDVLVCKGCGREW